MYNKKTLSKATAELDKAKAPKKPKDIITDQMGQWKYPGLPTRIPNNGSNDLPITMDGVYRPLLAIASTGEKKVMHPKENHTFREAKYVDEYPMKKGGATKRKTKSISGTNKLLEVNELFKNYKNRQFDPKAKNFQDGGFSLGMDAAPEMRGVVQPYLNYDKNDFSASASTNIPVENLKDYFKNLDVNAKYTKKLGKNFNIGLSGNASFNSGQDPEYNSSVNAKYVKDLGDYGNIGLSGNANFSKGQQPQYNASVNYKKQFKNGLGIRVNADSPLKNIRNNGNASVGLTYTFQDGGPQNNASEERFKKRLMKRYPGMQGVYGTDGENLSIIKDSNYTASDHGFGNIEFMFPGQDSVTYTDDYQYKNPTPDQYTTVYNPKGANRGDVFLDMMHGMRDDEEYQKLLQNFGATVKKGRGRDMDHWYNVEAQENPNYVEDGREVWDNNYIDGILRAELANKTIGRRVKGNDYNLERRGSTDEMRQAAKDIKKYLKTPQKPKQYAGPVVENNGFITPEYEDGGYIETELTKNEIEEYRKGGYIVEDISVPELNQAQKGKTVEISDPKEFAYRKKRYDDSLAVYNHGIKEKQLFENRIVNKHNLSKYLTTYTGKNYDNTLGDYTYHKQPDGSVIKFNQRGIEPINEVHLLRLPKGKEMPILKDLSKTSNGYMVYKKPTQPVSLKKAEPKKEEVVKLESIIKTPTTKVAKVENKPANSYPVGYQPYSLYGKVLDPNVYGYAESLNGKPVQVAQFADTYGYKAKMDAYRKSGKYPWVKQKGGAKDKYATHIGEDGTVGSTNIHTDKKGNITTKVQDSKGITHYKVKTKDGKVFYKQDASTAYPENNSISPENYKIDPRQIEMNDGALQPVDDVWTLPIGMSSAGVKGTIGLVKGLTSLGRNAAKSSLVQAGKAGLKKSLIKSLPGSSINNLVASGFAGTALTDILTGKVAEPWKKANKSGKFSDYADAVAENMFTALDAYPLYNAAGKGFKQLGKTVKNNLALSSKYLKALPGKKVVKATEDLKQAENKIEDIRRVYHNNERGLLPEESALLQKYGIGERLTYFDPVMGKKADAVLNKMVAVNKNPVLKTDPEYMQALVDKTQRLRRLESRNSGIGVQQYIEASPNFKSANQGLRKLENKFGNNWFEKPYTRDAVLNEYVSNPRFGPYNDSRFARYLSDANIDIQRRLANGQNITEADQNLLNAMRNRSDKTTELFNLYGHAQVNDPSRWQTALNENSNLRRTLQNENLFSSPEFAALPDNYRNQIIDFRNSNQQSLNNMFTHRGSIDLRRNVSHAQNSYTEPQQAFDDAIKELYNTEEAGKHAKKIEESLIKLNGNRIVPGSIPYHGVDKVPQYTIEDPSLLSSNDLNEINEKIDFVTKALKNPNLKNPKLKKSLETQLEDLHSNKWLRTGYHETMKEAGFKIPKEYEDMSMITQDNTKYLFDSKGNLIGNISGVSKEYPFIGSTGLMPHLHGTNPIGKESQMGKTLYRSIHHGLNNAHGVPLQTKGSFASTELLENGLPVQRKRAANMWNSGVAKGWFEDTGSGTYKVIKKAGGVVTKLTPKEIQEYINQGYIVEEH